MHLLHNTTNDVYIRHLYYYEAGACDNFEIACNFLKTQYIFMKPIVYKGYSVQINQTIYACSNLTGSHVFYDTLYVNIHCNA